MPAFNASHRPRALISWTSIPAVIATVVLLLAGIFADHQNRVVSNQALRADVTSEVNLIRAKLEGNINSNIQLVRGLVATIATEPGMKQPRFADLAENLLREETQLRNIAGAPGLVISLMYPMAGNEKALGLDYRADEIQREAALRARDSRELVLAGPVDLRQGGQGFVGRFPVFLDRPSEVFWGIVAAVIDVQELYRDSGLLDDSLSIEVALTGKDALGGRGGPLLRRRAYHRRRPRDGGCGASIRIMADRRHSKRRLECHSCQCLAIAIDHADRGGPGRCSDHGGRPAYQGAAEALSRFAP